MRRAVSLAGFALIGACMANSADDLAGSEVVSECDRQTAYVNDDGRVAPPVARADIDVNQAISVCEAAVLEQPQNGRLYYQLARVLGYDGQDERARQERELAAEAGYPAAQFVLGILDTFNANGDPDVTCRGARYMEQAVQGEAFVALAAYPAYRAEGLFDHCEGLVRHEELLDMLARAEPLANGYYRSMLVRATRTALSQQP